MAEPELADNPSVLSTCQQGAEMERGRVRVLWPYPDDWLECCQCVCAGNFRWRTKPMTWSFHPGLRPSYEEKSNMNKITSLVLAVASIGVGACGAEPGGGDVDGNDEQDTASA